MRFRLLDMTQQRGNAAANPAMILGEGCGPGLADTSFSVDNAAPAADGTRSQLVVGIVGGMHEIRLRCPRRENLVSDRDRSRGDNRIRRHAPCCRKILSQGAGKGDAELPAGVYSVF